METHQAAVASVAAKVRHFHQTQTPFRLYHGSTFSTRRCERRPDNTVDTSGLDRILEIDKVRKTAVVEPNVSMCALVRATLPFGLVPLVVMEFRGITVGGGFSGSSGESSSFRHGLFEATVNWIEIVLPTGHAQRASRLDKENKPDLFWGAASAFGTLGVVTLLEVRLMDALPYVRLTYWLSPSIAGATSRLQDEVARAENEYVDAIVFSPDSTLVCTGQLVDALPNSRTAPRRFSRSWDPWFYVHAKRMLRRLQADAKSAALIADYVPLEDYLFRYDRGTFWTAMYAFRYFVTPFNRITRFMLDPLLHTTVINRAMHQSGLSNFYMVQDVGIPYDKVEGFHDWLHANLAIYPLWLCPLRIRRDGPDAAHGLYAGFGKPDTPDLINFGIWGPLSFDRRDVVRQNQALERKVHGLGGMKCLYAHAYYTEDDFWAHFDRRSYDALRVKYGATYLQNVYDKVRVDVDAEEAADRATWVARLRALFWAVWPLRGLYGVYRAVVAKGSLLQIEHRMNSQYTEPGQAEARQRDP